MNFATKQEIFDHVVAHLRGMKARSVSVEGQCLYRGANGAKCAVGACISDEAYTPEMEGEGARTVISEKRWNLGHLEPFAYLLRDLQKMHDLPANWDNSGLNRRGDASLKVIADGHHLQFTSRFPKEPKSVPKATPAPANVA